MIIAMFPVIVIGMHGRTFRQLMLLAVKHGLTNGDYIFVCVDYYKQRKIFGSFDWKQVISSINVFFGNKYMQ